MRNLYGIPKNEGVASVIKSTIESKSRRRNRVPTIFFEINFKFLNKFF